MVKDYEKGVNICGWNKENGTHSDIEEGKEHELRYELPRTTFQTLQDGIRATSATRSSDLTKLKANAQNSLEYEAEYRSQCPFNTKPSGTDSPLTIINHSAGELCSIAGLKSCQMLKRICSRLFNAIVVNPSYSISITGSLMSMSLTAVISHSHGHYLDCPVLSRV